MKTATKYKEDIKALMDKANAMDAQCVNENRDPNSAELTIQKEILDTVQEYQEIVATLERKERMQSSLEKPDVPLTQPAPEKVANKGHGITIRDKDKFNSFGEQMAAIMVAGSPGGSTDPRLRIQAAATGLGESISSDGGFLVQTDFSTELLKQVFDTGILASRCRKIQISGNSNGIKIPGVDETSRASTRSGGVLAYWKDEAAAKTASKPSFRMIELSLKKLIGLCYATDELLSDSTALEGYIKQAFIDEFGFQIDDAIINGTGAGMPLGVLNSGSLVSVAAETGQAASTVIAENVINMYSRIFATSRPNAVWLINQNIEPQLFTMSLAVGTGGVPIYMPAGGLSGQPYGTLFGRPVIAIEQAATLGTVGDIMFGDFGNGYVLAEKGGIQSDMSIHVQFLYDESVFRFVLRVDGQPVRASALTPYKGGASYTQSHFIALATRS
jgi:HK97 family phage major capsid protein